MSDISQGENKKLCEKIKESRQRESNPPPQLGKLIYYRCTMSAYDKNSTKYYSKTKKDCNRFL